jgi:hypothetical protein
MKRSDNGLSSSPYLEYSCQALQESAEYEADLILVACARLQIIIDMYNRNIERPSQAPVWMHTSSVQLDLEKALRSLPPRLQSKREYSNLVDFRVFSSNSP